MKQEQIGGIWFKVVEEYEQKFLCFNDARLSWSDAQALMTFVSKAAAEKYVEPVLPKPVEPEHKLEVKAETFHVETLEETPKPKKAKKTK